jgi:hypothetical protein
MSQDHHVLHGLAYDRRKRRYKLRVMIARGRKIVSKRICIHVSTGDKAIAITARDAVLAFAGKLGLVVIRRAQARREKGGQDA